MPKSPPKNDLIKYLPYGLAGLLIVSLFCVAAGLILNGLGLLLGGSDGDPAGSATDPAPRVTAVQSTSAPLPTRPLTTPTRVTDILTGPAACVPAAPDAQTGRVTGVTDGDTITVEIEGREYRLRYIGIDTPENTTEVEHFGPEAAEKNAELVEGQTVTLLRDISETDRFGRLLRYVFVGDRFINWELVAQGYANSVTFAPDLACSEVFQTAEQQARQRGIGLWAAQGTPTPGAPCNCEGPDLDCGDFKSRLEAQDCFDYCAAQGLGDIFRLEGGVQNGLVCEALHFAP